MTALVGGAVERTISAVASNSTGLPGPKTRETRRQDLGDFGQVLRRAEQRGSIRAQRTKPIGITADRYVRGTGHGRFTRAQLRQLWIARRTRLAKRRSRP
jgi:hypothetical protein